MPQMTTAQALVRSLVREGVEVVFGLPGVQIMDVYDAFYHEPGIRLITTRHEQTAAYMADGYSRSTGKIGAALVVPGPGLLNAAAGIGTAYASSSPVLLLAGQVESYNIGKGAGAVHEVVDQLDVVKNITKWRSTIMEPGEAPEAVHEAMKQLQTGRPRPVALEIPSDVLAQSSDVDLLEPEVFAKESPTPDAIEQALSILSRAERPLIWAGGGINAADANEGTDTAGGSLERRSHRHRRRQGRHCRESPQLRRPLLLQSRSGSPGRAPVRRYTGGRHAPSLLQSRVVEFQAGAAHHPR